MTDTHNLKLPCIEAAQAQKHVTHNEALRALDAVVQLGVETIGLATPPSSPEEGRRYIVAAGASGAWAGRAGAVAAFQDGAWAFFAPNEGWLAWVADEAMIRVFDGGAWIPYASGLTSVNPVPLVGVNTVADATNRLAVKANAVLFSHDDVTPGDGSVRHMLNKAAVDRTASVLFQDGWSGRAELGLAGSDDFVVKVSADGSTWRESIHVDRTDATAAFPGGLRHAASGRATATLIHALGGTGVTSVWENSTPHAGLPRQSTIASVSGDLITITGTNADQSFQNSTMQGCAYVRLWNVSKSPRQSAWIRAIGTASQFYVKDAAAVAGWAPGETIQVGEPVGAVDGLNTTSDIVAVDISQMLQKETGAVFRQSAVLLGVGFATGGAVGWDAHLGFTPTGANGTFFSVYSAIVGALTSAMVVASTSQLSPISNSNLLLIRERTANGGSFTAGAAVRVRGIYT